MQVRVEFLVLALLSGACAARPPPDAARLVGPAAMLGDGGGALMQAQWAFADPSRTRGDPADAATAVAAVDFLAGDMNVNPRWAAVTSITKQQMLLARDEVRHALGIPPDVRSQLVVNRLMLAVYALAAEDRPAALAALDAPAFTLGPERTLASLGALPYFRAANLATQNAVGQSEFGGGERRD